MFASRMLIASAVFFAAAATAKATTIFSNIDLANPSYAGGIVSAPGQDGQGPLGNSFVTSGVSGVLSLSVELSLVGGGDDGGSFLISILGDSSGSPNMGDVIASTSVSDGAVLSDQLASPSVFAYTFGAVSLLGDTRYWVMLSDPCDGQQCIPSSVIWVNAMDDSGTGIEGNFWATTDQTSFDSLTADEGSSPFAMTINAPEPASLSLLGLGVLGLGCLRRRKTVSG